MGGEYGDAGLDIEDQQYCKDGKDWYEHDGLTG